MTVVILFMLFDILKLSHYLPGDPNRKKSINNSQIYENRNVPFIKKKKKKRKKGKKMEQDLLIKKPK